MKTIRFCTLIILFSLLTCAATLSESPTVTNITVVAHEYYDYYAMPDAEKWKKVKSVRIEGQNRAGSTQVYQCGPDGLIQATLYNVSVSSVVWQDGEQTYRSFMASPQTEVVHHFYQPF